MVDVNRNNSTQPFFVVDCADHLAREIQDARDELQKEVLSLKHHVQLLGDVVQKLIVLILPIILFIGITFLLITHLSNCIATVVSCICSGLTLGLLFLHLAPLNDAINVYLNSRVYTPNFVLCECEACHDRENSNSEQKTSVSNHDTFGNSQEPVKNPPSDKQLHPVSKPVTTQEIHAPVADTKSSLLNSTVVIGENGTSPTVK